MPQTENKETNKKLAAKRAAISKRNIEAGVKKGFGVGDHLKTIAEVAGMPKGTTVQVEEVRNGGIHLSCLILDGPRSGNPFSKPPIPAEEFLISAEDLELYRSKAQRDKAEEERLRALEG